jgi:hypothetical protein
MSASLFGGARTALVYAALGALCAATSLAGASAARWGGPPAQLEVDTASVLRADYAAGSTLRLPALLPEVIDSARQDAGEPGVARDLLTPPAVFEPAPEPMLVADTMPDGAVDLRSEPVPSASLLHETAGAIDGSTPAVDMRAGAPVVGALGGVSEPVAVAGVPSGTSVSISEIAPPVTGTLSPELQPVLDLVSLPSEPLGPLGGELTSLVELGSTGPLEVPVLGVELPVALPPIEPPIVPPLPELPLVGGLFH